MKIRATSGSIESMKDTISNLKLTDTLPYMYIIGGAIGLVASFILTLEKIHLLENPGTQLACDINPIISCGSAMDTWQGELLGFPNSMIGIVAFVGIITIGVTMLADAKFKQWFWQGLLLGMIAGVLLVFWFIYQSLYVLGTICPYCFVAWLTTLPLAWYTFVYMLQHKIFTLPKSLASVKKVILGYHTKLLITLFLIIFVLIGEQFWYYWKTLF